MGNKITKVYKKIDLYFLRKFDKKYKTNERNIQEWINTGDNSKILTLYSTTFRHIWIPVHVKRIEIIHKPSFFQKSFKFPKISTEYKTQLILKQECSKYNYSVTIPKIPENVMVIGFINVQINKWPEFPNSLRTVVILDSIAPPLTKYSPNIRSLNIINSDVKIQDPFPNSLTDLTVRQNVNKKCLPNSLPPNLEILHLEGVDIQSLPELPNSLRFLICKFTMLTSLPQLPAALDSLICNFTMLETLPILPSNLQTLDCSYSPIKSFPLLPPNLKGLCISYCKITNIPTLPKMLKFLECVGLLLQEFPTLPSSITLASLPDNDFQQVKKRFIHFHYQENYLGYNRVHSYNIHKICTYMNPQEYSTLWQNKFEARKKRRTNRRCRIVKEELMEKTWHPNRYKKWCLDEEEKKFISQDRTVKEWIEFVF